jgi:outer membrane receptor for Fe3+-dicitrate
LEKLTGSDATLVFTYVGFETKEVPVSGNTLNVQLKASINNLNEVVVVAYGTANKATYTGSASVVNAADLEKRQVSNISRTLQGIVPGLQSVASAGQPGSDASIRIRGIGSVNASSDPLYVVDGISYSGNINSIILPM